MNFKFKKRIFLLLGLFLACLTIALPLSLVCAGDVTIGLENPIEAENFTELIEGIIDWIVDIGILIAVGMIVYSGVLFMIAGGDKDKITTARKALTWSLIGLAVLIMGKNWITLIKSILEG